jgi:FtsH-binding integral membrane protein
MDGLTAADAANNPYTGPIAIVLFIAAHFINYKWGQGTRWAYAALALGICASFLFYSSTWAAYASDMLEGFLGTVVMSVVCVLAIIATIADIWNDPDYNNAAVWALLIGPVAALGSGGWVYGIASVLYGGMTIVVQGLVSQVLGA